MRKRRQRLHTYYTEQTGMTTESMTKIYAKSVLCDEIVIMSAVA